MREEMPLEVKSRGTIIIGVLVVVSFGTGILTGHLITPTKEKDVDETFLNPVERRLTACSDDSHNEVVPQKFEKYDAVMSDKWKYEKYIIQKLIERTDPQRIRDNLRYLSEKPHLAASERDAALAKFIQNKFQEAGFDYAELVPYNMLLSKPDPQNPNKVTLHENGRIIFESHHKEIPIHPDDEAPDFIDAFNAYTPAATVSTEPGVGVVYVNYGCIEDFDKLEELGINITGHIALVRYGKIYRGNKISHAEQAGATGIIIFSDPADVAPNGTDPENVYDQTWWLPGTGIQRGTAIMLDGDPLTPGWPSTEYAYRITEEEAGLHSIPSQPIGYDDARVILERLDGVDAPADWQGGFIDLRYKLGPLFKPEFGSVSLTLSTHNSAKIETDYNVIGIIKGSIEPDRYVLYGNHRDAWGYGASDPSSGTAQLLEAVRVYGTLLSEGWRPRRSLVFCSWGAEEYGLLGSQEWVEEHVEKLQMRSVAYLNVDICVSGPKLEIGASPMLWNIFHNVTSIIPGIENPSKSLFDEWKEHSEQTNPEESEHPIMTTLGAGSDYAPFTLIGGIPSADIWFRRDTMKHNISEYPYYHTGYETFYMVSTFVDPEFKLHQGCGRIASLAMKYLADSSILPYSISRYPEVMMRGLLENKNRDKLMIIYDKYPELENAVARFLEASKNFESKLKKLSQLEPLELRAINDQLMNLERSFIIPEGLPGRPTVKHAIFSPSLFDSYASTGFPGLTDLLHRYESLAPEEKLDRNKKLKRHISDLTIMVDSASSLLKEVHLI